MLALLTGRLGRYALMIAAAAAIVGAIYVKGRRDERAAWEAWLAQDRVQILIDGKEIDDEVLGADDDALCALLGGCLPVDAGGDETVRPAGAFGAQAGDE